MPKINLLPKNVSELIAAGEVVERPASVIKELIENSIDAGATVITVAIKRGGISYISITDNGCGIAHDDVPLAFLRHATSKIKGSDDLNSISTLGFRGEALAAVSSVARVEMLTKPHDLEMGTLYRIDGGVEVEYDTAPCPDGTTITIRDLFYNTPARMKFLKTDMGEGNACAAVIDRIALSHPEISFKLIRDGKQALITGGDGNIKNTVYSVLGKDYASSLIEVSNTLNSITVSGYICKPVSCKPTRNGQFTFLNGRLVRSNTVMAACEQAYKNNAMIGRFPAFVLYLTVPYSTVDVNVHPAKTEVRFSDEKRVFDAVYVAVKNALNSGDTRPEIKLTNPVFNRFERMSMEEFKQQSIPQENINLKKIQTEAHVFPVQTFKQNLEPDFINRFTFTAPDGSETKPMSAQKADTVLPVKEQALYEPTMQIKAIGEAFATYIVAQMGESLYLIDKHAAHERIIYNSLKNNHKIEVQALLSPVNVLLAKEEYSAIVSNIELLEQNGFEIEDFGNATVRVYALPTILTDANIQNLISEISQGLIKNSAVVIEKQESLFHIVACKAAIKAGGKVSGMEMQSIAEKVLLSKEIMYCPHGRPVAFEIKRKELEKKFGRIQ